MKRKPIVGETLVKYEPANRRAPARITEVTVSKVGTKYFEVEKGGWYNTFERSDWGIKSIGNTRYNCPAWIFEGHEELDARLEEEKIRRDVEKFFRDFNWQLSPEQYLAIHAIISSPAP